MANLTNAWTTCEAMCRSMDGWQMHGVVLGPRQSDPPIRGPHWVSWARGPNGEQLEAPGDSPESAVERLANRLRDVRGEYFK
jgi:hypothetical protein